MKIGVWRESLVFSKFPWELYFEATAIDSILKGLGFFYRDGPGTDDRYFGSFDELKLMVELFVTTEEVVSRNGYLVEQVMLKGNLNDLVHEFLWKKILWKLDKLDDKR